MRQWEWRSVEGSGWTCVRHMNAVVVQWLMLEASIALITRRHPWPGKTIRHHSLNDLIARSFSADGVPVVKEPTGLSDPDGLSLVPQQNGKALCWDMTVICPLANSYISAAARDAGAAAEHAASRKEVKYAGLDGWYMFAPIAFEKLGVPSASTRQLGRRLTDISGESRETSYLFQRCSVLIQRLTLLCCMTVCQIVIARITRNIQLFVDFPNNNNNNTNRPSASSSGHIAVDLYTSLCPTVVHGVNTVCSFTGLVDLRTVMWLCRRCSIYNHDEW